ncbi:MAG: hypothetical protein FJZ64_02720 [Chlamydiae bacterium]|nr:hypothetical protein [Chlamydiota bacterium]
MKKVNKILKVYGILGKTLCGCAGGVVGFLFGGPVLMIPAIAAGVLGGHLLEKGFVIITA